jgi:hypothetical protein
MLLDTFFNIAVVNMTKYSSLLERERERDRERE